MRHLHRRARLAVGPALAVLVVAAALIPGQLAAQGSIDPSNRQHYVCYIVAEQTPQAARTVQLDDQFTAGLVPVSVDEPLQFCNPVEKQVPSGVSPILAPEAHLTMYPAAAALPAPRTVTVINQFITTPQTFTVDRATVLLVPTTKAIPPAAPTDPERLEDDLNHYWCYPVEGPSVNRRVKLDDQFTDQPVDARVERPRLFCNPVAKYNTAGVQLADIVDEEAHLLCYDIKLPQRTRGGNTINIWNQLERDTFNVTSTELLCVPSEKNPRR